MMQSLHRDVHGHSTSSALGAIRGSWWLWTLLGTVPAEEASGVYCGIIMLILEKRTSGINFCFLDRVLTM